MKYAMNDRKAKAPRGCGFWLGLFGGWPNKAREHGRKTAYSLRSLSSRRVRAAPSSPKMEKPQDVIKQLASALHKDALKPRGFRKSGNNWARSDEWPKVIGLQNSKWNDASEARFTINLGVSIDRLHELSGAVPSSGSLKEYDCDVRLRIGQLFEPPRDHWWRVNGSESLETLVREVTVAVTDYGIPWLERLDSYESVGEELGRQGNHFMAALSFHLGGHLQRAESSMAEAFEVATPHFLPRLRRAAKANAIPIPG